MQYKPSYGQIASGKFRNHPLYRGCVGHWIMTDNGGLTLYDVSKFENHGTLTGGPTWGIGQFGPAISFDGSNDYVDVGVKASLDVLPYLTVTCWVKRGSNGYGTVFEKGNIADGYFYYAGSSVVKPRLYIGPLFLDATNFISATEWSHLAVSYDGVTVKHYLNGIGNGSGTVANDNNATAVAFLIGTNGLGSEYWNGFIDDMRVFNRPLAEDEITQIYNKPFSMFVEHQRKIFTVPAAPAGGLKTRRLLLGVGV